MVLQLGRRQRQYQGQTRRPKANLTKRMKLFRQLRSHVQGPPEDVEYAGFQGTEERHVQIDQIPSLFDLIALWCK